MTDVLLQYLLFALQTGTVVGALLLVIVVTLSLSHRGRRGPTGWLEVRKVNRHYRRLAQVLNGAALGKKELKRWLRQEKARQREAERQQGSVSRKRLFVLSFDGDLRASGVSSLREEVTAIATVATPADEVVLRLNSSGGLMHSYGLAASQLVRLKERKIPLTVAVDGVAASGGYLMACVANRIIAAPFAIVGSIGVIAQVPNLHRFLKEHSIDMEQHTAGKYKRTLSVWGENTDEMRRKFQEELQDAHALFQQFIAEHRPGLDLERVATGEHWFGWRARELKLVDDLLTSDDYLLSASAESDIFEVRFRSRQRLAAKFATSLDSLLERVGVAPRHVA